MARGFSFIETLISLVLVISISLALLKQQWQMSQWAQLAQIRYNLLVQLDNASERLLARAPEVTISKPYLLTRSEKDSIIFLRITFESNLLSTQRICTLTRRLLRSTV